MKPDAWGLREKVEGNVQSDGGGRFVNAVEITNLEKLQNVSAECKITDSGGRRDCGSDRCERIWKYLQT